MSIVFVLEGTEHRVELAEANARKSEFAKMLLTDGVVTTTAPNNVVTFTSDVRHTADGFKIALEFMQNPLLDQESTEWVTRFLEPYRGNVPVLFSLLSAASLLHYPTLQTAMEATLCDVCLRGKTPAECLALFGINTATHPFTEEEMARVRASYPWLGESFIQPHYGDAK